jgi:hypothetical protein
MFRVRWTRTAISQLAAIWVNAADQQAVTAASYQIEQLLRRDPANQGEDRPNNRRVIFIAPLVVLYRIDTTINVVTVVGVGRYGTA